MATTATHFIPTTTMDGMPDVTCLSGPPTSVAYPAHDLEAFAAQVTGVSSFSYPATADPSMLTPISNAGSPPMKQSKSQRSYDAGAQGPTPPNSSKTFYPPYGDVNSSTSSSPMHPAVTEAGAFEMMTPFMTHASSSPSSHHASPKGSHADIPPPIDPYLGHYGVSSGSEDVHGAFGEYHPFTGVVDVEPMNFFARQQAQAQAAAMAIPVSAALGNRLATTAPAPLPILNQPHPGFAPRSPAGARMGHVEDLLLPGGQPMPGYAPHMSPGRRAAPRKKPTTPRKVMGGAAGGPRTTPKQGSVATMDGMLGGGNGMANGGGLDVNEDGEREELTLADNAPEEEKFLFQLRKEFISEKGKGMWEEMKAKYSERHKGTWEKAALQMKVSRAVAKHGVWPKRELERLEESFRYVEERIYNLILARMKELGGCKCWDWKPQHIEAKLVKMGLVEPTVDEKTGTRRRKNKLARRRTTSSATAAMMTPGLGGPIHGLPHHMQPQHPHTMHLTPHHHQHHAAVMNDWAGGLGLHPALAMPLQRHASYDSAPPMGMAHMHHAAQQQHQQQQQQQVEQEEPLPPQPPALTDEQEDGLLDDLFKENLQVASPDSVGAGGVDDDGSSAAGRGDTLMFEDGDEDVKADREMGSQHSERVARQACEQMMQGQQQFAVVSR